MFYRLSDSLKRAHFDYCARTVLRSPALPPCAAPMKIVSMVCHADLRMYLLAIKSLRSKMPPAEIAILDDGTLTNDDHETLKHHLSPTDIVPAREIAYGRSVKGIRWEILLYIAECIQSHYVVQLDSDTLTLGQLDEVNMAVHGNRSFTLGTRMGKKIGPAYETREKMQAFEPTHVQIAAEQNLNKLPNYDNLKYVRGNSGLSGFAKGSFTRIEAEDFYENMGQNIGRIWLDHGGFQVSSNFFVANSQDAMVLPWPKYACFTPDIPYENSTFLHFIGSNRFDGGVYAQEARRVVKALLDPSNFIAA